MTRLEYNLQILDCLKAYAERYPDMRFGQMLTNLNIATHLKTYINYRSEETGDIITDTDMEDIFFPESEETLKTVMLSYPKEGV